MNQLKYFLFMFGLIASPLLHADILGVEDAALLAKAVEQVNTLKRAYNKSIQQYTATQNILSNAKTQLNSLNDLVKKNSGHYGFGSLQNQLADLKRQQWSADNWSDALKGKAGFSNSQYQALINQWQQNHQSLDETEFKKGASGSVLKNYQYTSNVNRAAGVQSEYAFNEINASLKRIHELSQKIETAENTKSAVDLNSRLLTEVAYLQTQNLKAQSLVNQQLAQKQALALSERAATSQYLAFDDE